MDRDKQRGNSLVRLVTFGALGLQLFGCAPDGGADETTTSHALVSRTAGDTSDTLVAARTTTAATTLAAAPTKVTTVVTTAAPPAPISPPPTAPVVQVMESGTGWRHVVVSGTAYDTQQAAVVTLGDEYYVIDGRAAIANAPLTDTVRAGLASKMNGTPPPAPGDEEIMFVPTKINVPQTGGSTAYALCDDDNNQVYSVSYDINQTFPYHVATQDNFSGTGDFSVRLQGSVTGTITYDLKRYACVPFPVFRRMSVTGNADVVADAALTATFKDKWSWSYQVADPTIGTVSLFGIPITFTAPITVGIDADAKATLNAHAIYQTSATFGITCNGSGCDGSKTATSTFWPGTTPTFGVNGIVNVTPWAKGAIHANVLDDSIAYGEVGVKARLPGKLWAYYGNTCGDGNMDGTPETVSATALDLGVGIDIVAAAGFLGDNLGTWSWNVWNSHLGFWSLGDNSAMSPIFYATWPTADALRTARMHAKMRPCWPFADAVTYQVTWNDGTTSTVTGPPGTATEVDHAYTSYGTKMIDITALHDAVGRNLGGTTHSSAMLSPVDLGGIISTGGATLAQ